MGNGNPGMHRPLVFLLCSFSTTEGFQESMKNRVGMQL